ncbi:hypothetical protein BGZ99_009863 [Dissophora globulifera]|uniref:Nucleolar protein Dnt1-like N-terminal domain-containing protein n=1 Tax=Dissophora globulifera TaxID=979702 RepID=A0A9P6RUE0_9FUNG|nr:hypothetical protein BGZ99_009863 [Dissophora globulifera]
MEQKYRLQVRLNTEQQLFAVEQQQQQERQRLLLLAAGRGMNAGAVASSSAIIDFDPTTSNAEKRFLVVARGGQAIRELKQEIEHKFKAMYKDDAKRYNIRALQNSQFFTLDDDYLVEDVFDTLDTVIVTGAKKATRRPRGQGHKTEEDYEESEEARNAETAIAQSESSPQQLKRKLDDESSTTVKIQKQTPASLPTTSTATSTSTSASAPVIAGAGSSADNNSKLSKKQKKSAAAVDASAKIPKSDDSKVSSAVNTKGTSVPVAAPASSAESSSSATLSKKEKKALKAQQEKTTAAPSHQGEHSDSGAHPRQRNRGVDSDAILDSLRAKNPQDLTEDEKKQIRLAERRIRRQVLEELHNKALIAQTSEDPILAAAAKEFLAPKKRGRPVGISDFEEIMAATEGRTPSQKRAHHGTNPQSGAGQTASDEQYELEDDDEEEEQHVKKQKKAKVGEEEKTKKKQKDTLASPSTAAVTSTSTTTPIAAPSPAKKAAVPVAPEKVSHKNDKPTSPTETKAPKVVSKSGDDQSKSAKEIAQEKAESRKVTAATASSPKSLTSPVKKPSLLGSSSGLWPSLSSLSSTFGSKKSSPSSDSDKAGAAGQANGKPVVQAEKHQPAKANADSDNNSSNSSSSEDTSSESDTSSDDDSE